MKKLILLFAIFLCVSSIYAQDEDNKQNEVQWCGFNPTGNNRIYSARIPATDSIMPNALLTCGGIRVFFKDVQDHTGAGFDDSVFGPTRRDRVCAVMNYIQSKILFPSSTTSAPLTIYFRLSTNDSTSSKLATAEIYYPSEFSPLDPPAATPGYYGGLVYDYLILGHTIPSNMEHGAITVNFAHSYYYTNSTTAIGNCEFDFDSTILHEFTHLLGIASLITQGGDGQLQSIHHPGVFTVYDREFLYYYDTSNNFNKLVLDSSGTGYINPAFTASLFTGSTQNRVWIDNSVFSNKTNQPVNSQFPFNFGTSLSHLDQDYNFRTYQSPAFSPNYVMNGSFGTKTLKNTYTKEELRILERLGYNINTANVPNYNNLPPNITGNVKSNFSSFPDDIVPAGNNNLIISATNCQRVTINLVSKTITNGSITHTLGLSDINNNPISVFNGQLFNLRGCGSIVNGNGNNNAQLLINGTNNEIIFTPRKDFTGRAQFAFHLFDGIDRGAYIVITIDVTADSCFNNNNEHIINGSLENGMLINTTDNPNNLTTENTDTTNNYIANRFVDGQQYLTSGWQDQYVIGDKIACPPIPDDDQSTNNSSGVRYTHIGSGESIHQRLDSPLLNCHNYKFSIDVVFPKHVPKNTSYVVNLSLRNTIDGANLFTIPITIVKNNAANVEDVWHSFNALINYTNTLPAKFIFIDATSLGINDILIDNISITDDLTNPGTFPNITITPSSPASINCGGSVNLTATGASTYSWSPATGLNTTTGGTVVANPTSTTTYTVTGTNTGGCQGQTLVTVTVAGRITPTFNDIQPICFGTTAPVLPTSSNDTPAITGTWSPAIVSNTQTGTYTFTPNNTCANSTSITIYVLPENDPSCGVTNGVCSPNITLSTPEINPNFLYKSYDWIVTNSTYSVASGKTITMEAENYIRLTPNTQIQSGSIFIARIKVCEGATKMSNQDEIPVVPVIENGKITIFPNPNKGNFTVQLNSSTAKEVHIIVNDMSGRVIFDKKYTNTGVFSQNLQLDNLRAGIYLVTVQNGERKEVKRIIVE